MPETRPPIDLHRLSLAEVEAAAREQRRPPVERWDPPHCGTSGIRIDREGRWWHEGRRLEREALVRLFASILRREPDGRHLLVTPVEKLDVEVEFTALRAIAMRVEGEGEAARLLLQLDSGEVLTIGADHPLTMREGLPVVAVRGGLEASFARPVYFELAERALANDPPGIWSDGSFFALSEA